jgi:hypothetical protein
VVGSSSSTDPTGVQDGASGPGCIPTGTRTMDSMLGLTIDSTITALEAIILLVSQRLT